MVRLVAWPAALVLLLSCNALTITPSIDLRSTPGWTIGTTRFEAGTTYTFGWQLKRDQLRQLRLTSVEIINSRGIRLIGYGARALGGQASAITLEKGWPPEGATVDVMSPDLGSHVWDAESVELDFGIEMLEVPSGLRGLLLNYADAGGNASSEIMDVAVVTRASDAADMESTLQDLGLLVR